jgi:hypothetical protein
MPCPFSSFLHLLTLLSPPPPPHRTDPQGKSQFKTPIHLEVSFASKHAISAVEAVGGSVTCVYFNELALRALMKPYKFEILPNRARPSPKIINYYLDPSKCGYLSPEIQLRNIKRFGFVTSEERYRQEHEEFMEGKRKEGLLSFRPLPLASSSSSSRQAQAAV